MPSTSCRRRSAWHPPRKRPPRKPPPSRSRKRPKIPFPGRDDPQRASSLPAHPGRAPLEYGLMPEFSPEAMAEADRIPGPAEPRGDQVRDLRSLLWCSIDNDDSRDLDQLTVADSSRDRGTTVLVAVAQVCALVAPGSALDEHASTNTTSV